MASGWQTTEKPETKAGRNGQWLAGSRKISKFVRITIFCSDPCLLYEEKDER